MISDVFGKPNGKAFARSPKAEEAKCITASRGQSTLTRLQIKSICISDRLRLRDMYLAAATYLSSRAFPSTLLSPTPSLAATPSSYAVLLPGVDSLNHARGQPVTWEVSRMTPLSEPSRTWDTDLGISLTLETPFPKGAEIFNNYGPKPNSSLILGYGFSLEDNPDDTIMLKIGSRTLQNEDKGPTLPAKSEYEIGRNARGAEALWKDVHRMVEASFEEEIEIEGADQGENENEVAREIQLDMQTAETLSEMVSDLHDRLPMLPEHDLSTSSQNSVRTEVRTMWKCYVRGQIDILDALLAWLDGKDREAVRRAQEIGINVLFEGEDST